MTSVLPTSSDVITVTSLDVARCLGQLEQVQLLRLFMGPEGNTVAAAARQLNLPLQTVYRRVKGLLRLQLLFPLREVRRPGRSVQVYRCPARRFFIPRTLVPLDAYLWEGLEPFMQAFRSEFQYALEHDPQPVAGMLTGELPGGFLFTFADQHREPWPAPNQPVPAVISLFQTIRMDYAQARAFNQELQALVERHNQAGGAGTYLLGLFLTPTRSTEGVLG
ncbi:hypothetical protein [Deinococcus multiflagellatus]|uniref:Helix-turn-helix domain-containing protein n=1 Tax=Deinococcus multiflagellatus TaxID=1656887 RepID=A0ABW1ZS55_9DEIO|nr:hypothetical protein [Deinococcus multiflagellatus]MBZ9715012.1 hypothetical protein [Deinococcus multiflagellatus]